MSKSRDIADSAATINYIDTVTSNVQDQIDNIDPLPSQTGNAGKFLTTDGTNASWAALSTSPSVDLIASGTLANGDTVIVNADGTVSAVLGASAAVGSPTVFETAQVDNNAATFDSNSNKVVIAYRDNGNSNYGTAVVGTVSGTSISFGTPVVFENASIETPQVTFDSNSNKVVISYADVGNSYYGTAVVGTVSGTTISFGTPVVFHSNTSYYVPIAFDSNSNKVVIAYRDGGNLNYGTAVVGTVSGTSISFGTPVVFNGGTTFDPSVTFDSNSNKIVIAYRDGSNSSYGTAVVGTVSGTAISFGSETVFINQVVTVISATFDSSSNKVVIAYIANDNLYYGTAIVGTVSGTSISFGTPIVFESANSGYTSATFDSSVNKIIIAYADNGNSNYGTVISGTVSGTSISFDDPVVFESAGSSFISATFDSNSNKVAIAYRDVGNSNYGTGVVYTTSFSNLSSENYIGISDAAYTDGQTAKIQIAGSVDDAQSGLSAGQKYYVQLDGSLSTTPDSTSVVAGTAVSATKLIVKG